MAHVLVRFEVEDYAKWKAVFDEMGQAREDYGSQGGWLFRSPEDANALSILLNYEDEGRLREYLDSQELKEAMARGGIKGAPEIHVLEQIGEVPV